MAILIVGQNDLSTVNQELATQCYPTLNGDWTPGDVTVGSNRKVWWKCSAGHEWQAVVFHRPSGQDRRKCIGPNRRRIGCLEKIYFKEDPRGSFGSYTKKNQL